MSGIVGRSQELASVTSFVDGVMDGPAALVLEGAAGIGKSTLWLSGVERARSQGLRVLVCRPAEAERDLVHAALGDLLDGVLDEVAPSLSPPRRRALGVALLRQEESPEHVDPRALAVAVADVLLLLGERQPILIAVDDLQWLDPASSGALAFALRRIGGSRVLLLLSRRPVDAAEPAGLELALAPERVQHLPVGPLSVGALHRLLRDRMGRAFPRQTLLRIQEQSGGNPFFALELARILDADVDPAEPLHVPETLDGLLRARLAGLTASTREALGLASALGTTSESLLLRLGVAEGALDAAAAAQVLERESGLVRFTHPLLLSVVYHDLGERRREVHRRIAEVVDDPLLRARHLALATEAPDVAVASELDETARIAIRRGAPELAAELHEHAARLTPPEARDQRYRRALAAAHGHRAAGEWTRARSIATRLLAEPQAGVWRAEALMLLAELEGLERAAELLEEALAEVASDLALQSVIHARLAWARRFEPASDHADTALELAERLGDDNLRQRARAVRTILAWFAGEGVAPDDLLALDQHLAEAIGGERLVQEATQALANTLAPAPRRDDARALLEREYGAWRERDEPRGARALWGLAWVEFWAGRWPLAADHASRAHDIAIQYGLEVPQDHLPIAVIAVHRGDLDMAREHSERGLDLAQEQFGFHPPQHLAVRGLVARGSGDSQGALQWLRLADQRAAGLGWGEPSMRWWTGDEAELLLEVGRIEDAVELLDAWETAAMRVGREWVLAQVTRCRGVVAAARGDVALASGLLAQAVVEHEALGDPFGRARALLALGTVRRRTRQKRPAREAIEAALDGFEKIDAAGWAARARAELGRIGGRTREEGLTAAERRVASLVAEGRTNREIAAALFLGERTVASHLTHIYAKIGVRSRTELARKVQTF